MRKTRWARKFAGRDLRAIAALGEKPGKDEGSLRLVWDSLGRVFRRCRSSISSWRDDEEDGDLVLGWLNSPQKEKCDPVPFSIYYETSTHEKYVASFSRFICYCLRLLHADDRHGHVISTREEEALQEIWSMIELDDMNENALDTRIFELSVAFWMHESRAHSKSAIVHFCAVLGIDGKRGCYRLPSDYGQILAALLYCARLLLFEYALPVDERAHIVNPCKTFLKIHNQWLVDGRPTPFHFINNLLAYALGAGKDVGGKPRVQWSADKQTLIYQGQRLHLSQLRNFVTQLCDAAEEILYKDLMFLSNPSTIRSIDLRELVDDMNDSTVGYSFVTDQRNNLRGGRRRMLNRLKTSSEWATLLKAGSDGLELKGKVWRKYLALHEKFKEIIFLLVHIPGGPPARGGEILPIRHTNATQNMRNIFALDGQVMIVTAYHKSQAITGQHKVLPRFLPSRVGQFLVAYLAEVLPFITLVDRDGVPSPLRSFLWVDGKGIWDTPRATKILTQETSIRINFRITFQDYRHIAKAIDREHVRGLIADTDDDQDDIHDLAAAHSSSTADRVYGVDASMLRSLSARTINAFRTVTDRWHRFLQVNSRQQWSEKSRTRGLSQTAYMPERKRHKISVERDELGELQLALERLLGPGATFRSQEQKEALLAIWRGDGPLVVVLPPGGGKSLLFQLPASLPTARVTVVIVPFLALIGDLRKRCRDLGISCRHWTIDRQQAAAVVLVIGEAAVSDTFLTFVSDLQVKGKLDRIVIDECHIVLTSAEYRRQLPDLDRLRAVPCQFVLLTGTLPPCLEGRLADALLLGTQEHGLRIIRAITNRSNVVYKVATCDDSQVQSTVCELMEQARQKLKTDQKAVVFCGDRSTCERLAKALGCQPYHATWESKDSSLALWADGKEKIMVATSALGTGVDISGIRLVVHLGRPHSIIDFVQEVGRAGRGGETVQSMVVIGKREMKWLCSAEARSLDVKKEAMRLFLINQQCRREQLGGFMDRQGKPCGESKGEKCDRCQQTSEDSEEHEIYHEVEVEVEAGWAEVQRERYGKGQELWEERVRERGLERERIERAVAKIGQGCPACWVHGVGDELHGVDSCGVLREAIGGDYRQARRLIKYEANSCCYRCSLPGDWCSWYAQRKKCSERDIIVPMVLAGRGVKEIRQVLEREVGTDELTGLLQWMGKRSRVGGSNGTNAVRAAGIITDLVFTKEDG